MCTHSSVFLYFKVILQSSHLQSFGKIVLSASADGCRARFGRKKNYLVQNVYM